jgi:hypothetical protein
MNNGSEAEIKVDFKKGPKDEEFKDAYIIFKASY